MLGMESGKRTTWTLRAARPEDLGPVRDLLADCELPVAGLGDQFDGRYVIAEKDGRVVGVAGVEVHGRHGLLRSVAVSPAMRSSGLGGELVSDRIAWTRTQPVESLYLLTTTAEIYFAKRGFVAVTRDLAPADIQASSEFSELCPSSAALMRFAGTLS